MKMQAKGAVTVLKTFQKEVWEPDEGWENITSKITAKMISSGHSDGSYIGLYYGRFQFGRCGYVSKKIPNDPTKISLKSTCPRNYKIIGVKGDSHNLISFHVFHRIGEIAE